MRTQPPGVSASGQPEQLKGVRRNMARVMADAHAKVVPTTLCDDADLHAWIGKQDITARLVRAMVAACKTVPALNAWFDGDNLSRTLHPHVDIGIAVDTDDGLFVPALRNADMLDARGVRTAIQRLRAQVEERSIPASELSGYTISLSNFGMFAGRYATPVVVPPCVAIVGAGKLSHDVVAVIGGIEVHRRMPISLTFDHRACTGGEAARFLKALLDDMALPDNPSLAGYPRRATSGPPCGELHGPSQSALPVSSSIARPTTSPPRRRSGARRSAASIADPDAGDVPGTYVQFGDTRDDLHIEVQKVDHASRVHLDIEADDIDAEAARLEKLGAKKIAFVKRWWVMEAPTGQRFCVVEDASSRARHAADHVGLRSTWSQLAGAGRGSRATVQRRVVGHHAIAAARLGAVQRLVGAIEDLLGPVARRFARGDADRHGQRETAAPPATRRWRMRSATCAALARRVSGNRIRNSSPP